MHLLNLWICMFPLDVLCTLPGHNVHNIYKAYMGNCNCISRRAQYSTHFQRVHHAFTHPGSGVPRPKRGPPGARNQFHHCLMRGGGGAGSEGGFWRAMNKSPCTRAPLTLGAVLIVQQTGVPRPPENRAVPCKRGCSKKMVCEVLHMSSHRDHASTEGYLRSRRRISHD